MKGAYLLLIDVKKDIKIKIGKLGILNLKKGNYVYVGSALNNLNKRIERHLSKNKKLHWHIDYLLKNKNSKIKKVFYKGSNKKQECEFAKKILKFSIPVKNFGSSDCKCGSHLFKI